MTQAPNTTRTPEAKESATNRDYIERLISGFNANGEPILTCDSAEAIGTLCTTLSMSEEDVHDMKLY